MNQDIKSENGEAVRWSAWLGDGPRCMNCHGAPHTLGECPGCGTREEMEDAIKRLNRAMRLYEQAIRTACCCNSDLAAEEDDCEHCELVVKARVMVRGRKSPNDRTEARGTERVR